ncbi:hypothetical protein PEX1_028310 [Penicillium expansum]|uniref:Uncharacterized protein n=1 Tax=Penicillium expansum TaxID=27334 RepID=A0A0A2J3X2_PENEN|nr:hypothetical protein PEX2_071830 [Penicillium expansum]KGO38821.1 hypothetical protein PEXP_097690 [Penicillium expansum]KGO47070.1 hypothetical protein PEX1_028310 [Penicillium expansum]KGO54700.1 hypothetical protein PEX2_071830 [Penicillium expansum]
MVVLEWRIKLCADYPSRVKKTILIDLFLTLPMYTKIDFHFSKAYFHWSLLIQDAPLPEILLSGDSRKVMELFIREEPGEGCEIYLKNLEDPATVHAIASSGGMENFCVVLQY